MLQQTTVAAVTDYFMKFTKRWPDVHALAASPLDDVLAAWAGLGYYARARNLHKCAVMVSRDLGGVFPDAEEGLLKLPGIGPYTAAAIAAIAFDRRATVVDGNVERVMARIHAEADEMPGVKPRLRGRAEELTPDTRPGDYAQAVMDLGATICTPKSPNCLICPWRDACAGRAEGIAASLPRKAAKQAKPIREGIAWIVTNAEGQIVVERRPETGLLGGMLALPTAGWDAGGDREPPLADADWQSIGEVRHTFTHFHLRLDVLLARAPKGMAAEFMALEVAEAAMPTVFAKICRLARAHIA
jgi:A/G-specific adenine glycosylase